MILLHQAQGQDVTIDSLESGPGILPFKLGNTKIISHYHSFLNSIDLDEIRNQTVLTKIQISDVKLYLNNKSSSLYEPHLHYLENKLDRAISFLNTFGHNRVKRGLINGLGSVIKSISGNLDYTDAIRYNNAITTLQNNEYKLESKINEHISLAKEWSIHSSKILGNIVQNQNNLTEILNTIIKMPIM